MKNVSLTDEILRGFFENRDEKYRDFQAKLIPAVDKNTMIGVRTPVLRKMAKAYVKNADSDNFLSELPHKYFEENQLHAFIISEMKDYDECVARLNAFLPFVDNWATCDQLSPKIFKKHRTELLREIKKWIVSEKTYTVRFAIGMLLEHYLDGDFKPEYLETVASVKSNEYYINMMISWYFATALAKQFDSAVKYLENNRLDKWTHNKTIQKAVESYRIMPEQKEYLKALKIR